MKKLSELMAVTTTVSSEETKQIPREPGRAEQSCTPRDVPIATNDGENKLSHSKENGRIIGILK